MVSKSVGGGVPSGPGIGNGLLGDRTFAETQTMGRCDWT